MADTLESFHAKSGVFFQDLSQACNKNKYLKSLSLDIGDGVITLNSGKNRGRPFVVIFEGELSSLFFDETASEEIYKINVRLPLVATDFEAHQSILSLFPPTFNEDHTLKAINGEVYMDDVKSFVDIQSVLKYITQYILNIHLAKIQI